MLAPEETQGTHFLSLDIGLPVGELRQAIRDVLAGSEEFVEVNLAATNRRGKPINVRVNVGPLRHIDRSAAGAILLMDEQVGQQ